MEIAKQPTAALRLHIIVYAVVLFAQATTVTERQGPCDLEAGLCGWSLWESVDGSYNVGRDEARRAPGPPVDAVPGTAQGNYVYLNYTAPPITNQETLLTFPTYQYVCALSLSYYTTPSLDVSVVRVNIGKDTLPPATTSSSDTAQWSHQTLHYNVSAVARHNRDQLLKISVEWLELGEAGLEEGVMVAAVDDITLSFCLPCDFDLLPLPGNLELRAPPALNVSLGSVTNLTLLASSPLCPSLPLVFTIDAVEPPALVGIFSVGRESGVIVVDASGPHLLAAGTLGHINVSVHVLGSNYTETSPPHRATATISLEQDPVIRLHDPPSELTVEVGVPFSLQLHAAHILPSSQPLTYHLHTSPSSLQTHVSVSNLGEVTGVITIETVPNILTVGGATLIVDVANEFHSSLNITIPLIFPPSPPLSLNPDLSYSVSENHSAAMTLTQLANVSLIDPNGDLVAVAATEWFDEIFELYPLGSKEGVWQWEGGLFVDQTRLDYENRSSYALPLTVTDSVDPALTTPLVFHITVKSENEHAPKFINFEDSERIQASWRVGALVTPEKASDQDDGPAGEVSYDITAGNENQFFLIDEEGDVRVASSPLLPGTYQLTITVTDRGSPPLSTCAVLTVTVEAEGQVDCTSDTAYSVPAIHTIGIDDSHIRTPVGSNATLYCSYQANPAVALYKWDVNPVVPPDTFSYVYPLSSPSPHVSLLPHQLTLVGVRASDAAFYTCSVTNWCGTATAVHILFVIDLPLPVEALSWRTEQLSSADKDLLFPTSVNISWTPPSPSSSPSPSSPSSPVTGSPLVDFTADTYLVQGMLYTGDHDDGYHDITEVPTSVTSVLVQGLLPGNSYYVWVSSVNEAGATPSDSISIATPPTTPKLASVDTWLEANLSLLITWELAYDGGYPISQFTITITSQSPRARRQEGGVVYHVDPSAGLLLSQPLPSGRRYLVTLALENQVGAQDYRLSEYVGHVASIQCDFEPHQQCPWQVEEGSIVITLSSGGVVEATVSGEGSKVILEHMAAGYACGYGFSYQMWGGVGLQVRVGGGGEVVWEDLGDTRGEWKKVSTSEAVDVDYLTPSVYSSLEVVATSNGSGGGVRLDMLLLDLCLPCDMDTLRQPGGFSLTYPSSATLHLRETSQLHIIALLTECDTAVIDVESIRVVPSVLGRYVSSEVSGHNVSLSVDPIPSDLAVHSAIIQVSLYIVGSDYGSPAGDMSTAVVGVAEIEVVIVEQEDNCSDVISCGFEAGPCGWSLGENTSLVDTGSDGVGVWLPLSHSHTGDVVLNRVLHEDSHCRLSLDHVVQGAELVATVSGVGVVWTSGSGTSTTANFTFDLQAFSVREEREVTLSLGEVWGGGSGSVLLDNLTLYPCTLCPAPPSGCPPAPSSSGSQLLVVAVVGGVAGVMVAALSCCLCLAVCCLVRSRRATAREKRWREMDHQRLMSDEESVGTAGSLGRASQASNRRHWKNNYGESSTLMTFMSEDESCGKGFREESSWLEAVELTHTRETRGAGGRVARGLGARGEVLKNPLYDDEEEEEEGEGVEMSGMEDWTLPPPPSTTTASDL